MDKISKCDKHPKYNGSKKPRTDCDQCWKIYLKKQERKKRVPIRPTKVIPDKTKYTRKKKHKKKEE